MNAENYGTEYVKSYEVQRNLKDPDETANLLCQLSFQFKTNTLFYYYKFWRQKSI